MNDSLICYVISQDMEITVDGKLDVVANSASTSNQKSERIPLLNREAVIEAAIVKEAPWPRKSSCRGRCAGPILTFRPSIYIIAAAAICLGICAVVFHPRRVGEFAVSIRRCLLG